MGLCNHKKEKNKKKIFPPRHFWQAKLVTQTYLERMVHGLNYWERTKKHLDMKNWTLCPGSRYRDDFVPSVRYSPDNRMVKVIWDGPDYSSDDLRARSAVSSPLTPSGAQA